MNVHEIGSEFHYIRSNLDNKHPLPLSDVMDYAYTFSGRTAIETVIGNIKNIKKVLLPSYCCESMISPFLFNNIKIEFYNVFWNDSLNICLDIDNDVDLILWCNYFGFNYEMPDLKAFIDRGGIIIEDITHSFLSKNPYNFQSQYIVASVRKWFPLISGGYCASLVSKLINKPNKYVSDEYIRIKKRAMKRKALYLENNDDCMKEQYLEDFSWSNHRLADNYSKMKIDQYSEDYLKSIDIESLKMRRLQNASLIYKYLNAQMAIRPIFNENQMDCPLFIPIICKTKIERDKLRKKLINNKIYCPIHWPKPEYCESNIYDLEMSLICDQRYEQEDIDRMMQIVCD